MEKNDYDCIIIGAGPGGLQAAIYLARYNRKVILIDQGGGRTRHALHIENYLGLKITSGKELVDTGIKQIESFGADFRREQVTSIRVNKSFIVNTNNDQYQTPYVIVSSGASENLPKITGMNRFFSQTVFTCVDCDGYRTTGRKLVILGDSLDAMRLAFAMKQMFTQDITLILPPGVINIDHAKLLAEDNITCLSGIPQEFLGETTLIGLSLTDGQNIACETVMLSYDYILNDSFLSGLSLKREGKGNKITTDHACETSVANLFVLGALKSGHSQAIIAAGQGAKVGIEINSRLLDL
jgi:thioredoxin reductase (NADPH)